MWAGRAPCPEGMLPIFSVGSEEEATRLLIMTCPRNNEGQFFVPELAQEQSLENLYAFGDKLRERHDRYLAGTDKCQCKPTARRRRSNRRRP